LTWTYTNPATSDRDAVRFEIGDTNSADPQITDEEIAYVLAEFSDVVMASIRCCEALIAKYARLVSQGVGSVNVSYSDRIAHYQSVIARLQLRAPSTNPFAGGTKVADKEAADEDTGRDAPFFKVGMFDRRY